MNDHNTLPALIADVEQARLNALSLDWPADVIADGATCVFQPGCPS
jgi:hypothetical protein